MYFIFSPKAIEGAIASEEGGERSSEEHAGDHVKPETEEQPPTPTLADILGYLKIKY